MCTCLVRNMVSDAGSFKLAEHVQGMEGKGAEGGGVRKWRGWREGE